MRRWAAVGGGTGGLGGLGGQHHDAHAVVALAAAGVEAGVVRAGGGRAQAGGKARVGSGRGRLGRGAHVGGRRLPVAAPLGALLGPQAALHGEGRARRHRHAAVLVRRLCAGGLVDTALRHAVRRAGRTLRLRLLKGRFH